MPLTIFLLLILEYSLRYSSTPSCQANVTNETNLVNETRDAFTATYLLRRMNSKYRQTKPYLLRLVPSQFETNKKKRTISHDDIFSALIPMQYVRGVHHEVWIIYPISIH